MSRNTKYFLGQSVITLVRDYETVSHYVDIPLEGLLAFEAVAMDDLLASFGLETMDDDECPWECLGTHFRVHCAEIATSECQ